VVLLFLVLVFVTMVMALVIMVVLVVMFMFLIERLQEIRFQFERALEIKSADVEDLAQIDRGVFGL
jgi:uncharacterized membrane protein